MRVNKPIWDDACDVHPDAFVTLKIYVPGASPVIVVLDPDPVVVILPGVLIKVHDPEAGRPFKTTLPVGTVSEGCVIVPITGADGVGGCAFITALPDAAEVHPEALVAVNANMPAGIPEIVALAPVPEVIVPPGVLVTDQVPFGGNPLNTVLPVARAHVGWVIVPTVGADGVDGCTLITRLAEGAEIHPEALVTVYEKVPAGIPDIVVLEPVSVAVPPGVLVKVQVPVGGNPVNTTPPVGTVQVGWVMVPTAGGAGVNG